MESNKVDQYQKNQNYQKYCEQENCMISSGAAVLMTLTFLLAVCLELTRSVTLKLLKRKFHEHWNATPTTHNPFKKKNK